MDRVRKALWGGAKQAASTTGSIRVQLFKCSHQIQSEARNANGRLCTISQAVLNIQTKIIIWGLAPRWL